MTVGGSARWAVLMAGVVAALASTGCGGVSRRFVVESNVPSAQVYINDRPVGAAPAHSGFEYYGFYKITVVHPDYRTETKRVHVVAPWYAYPPFDFLAEIAWPFHVEDVRRYYFELSAARATDTGELISNADALRERGWNLPPPPQPAADHKARPAADPSTLGPILPAPTPLPAAPPPGAVPLPAPSPVIPSVTPARSEQSGAGTFLR